MINNPKLIFENDVILWGASEEAFRIIDNCLNSKVNISAIVDNNSFLQGEAIKDKMVVSINFLQEKYANREDYIIIITGRDFETARSQLEKAHLFGQGVYTSLAFRFAMNSLRLDKQYADKLGDKYLTKCRVGQKAYQKYCNDFNIGNSMINRQVIRILNHYQNVVLVFSPPKTGTTSVVNTILSQNGFALHFHDIAMLVKNFDPINGMEYWREILDNYLKYNKLKIIAGVREPVSRDLSAAFHWFYELEFCEYQVDPAKPFVDVMIEKLYKNIERTCTEEYFNYWQYIMNNQKYGHEFDWFDVEMKKFFDIDIYKTLFDREKGYQIYKKGNIEVLVYKMEKMNENFASILEFAGVNPMLT